MTTKQCPVCNGVYEPILVRITNKKIQEEFPNVPKWQREQLISGLCSNQCWWRQFNVYCPKCKSYNLQLNNEGHGYICLDCSNKGFVRFSEPSREIPEVIEEPIKSKQVQRYLEIEKELKRLLCITKEINDIVTKVTVTVGNEINLLRLKDFRMTTLEKERGVE